MDLCSTYAVTLPTQIHPFWHVRCTEIDHANLTKNKGDASKTQGKTHVKRRPEEGKYFETLWSFIKTVFKGY
ncbi:hypothetical protein E2C01_002245 [Portunus trituberculatus]|uniref:Uncharacterized protein n=1 Tax=Portunus trituberculatus TaxID=210409 RepID=A0A5B7CJF6_PORTR|nr:hypothetical protein [Portunus trituberculatus]